MPKCCIICGAEASQDLQLQYCAQCQSALYCSRTCQRRDWNKQHQQICKLLNVGHEDMQVRTDDHTHLSIASKKAFEVGERIPDEDMKRFFNLFQESTFEGSQTAARKMKKIAEGQIKRC
jgi:hemerythrin